MTIQEFEKIVNQWGQQRVPFLFLIDFEMEKPQAWLLSDVNAHQLKYDLRGRSNADVSIKSVPVELKKNPIPISDYTSRFNIVMRGLEYGNSFLTNLTIKTPVETNITLEELFHQAQAPYKLWMSDQFVVFSPETFVSIQEGKIFSFPMKGTIDARLERAEERILQDPKEMAEHVTIVDLIRNDLSRVASHVKVERFRYIDRIETNQGPILQVSSRISGKLPSDFFKHIGSILLSLLPAGSISGAPKDKTVAIIREAEGENRGYYTGVFGYFDGANLDSAVMIRYIEKINGQLFFRSGGGITTQSDVRAEYAEALTKVYVPVV